MISALKRESSVFNALKQKPHIYQHLEWFFLETDSDAESRENRIR